MTTEAKREHNRQLPVSRIPAEVLGQIISMIRDSFAFNAYLTPKYLASWIAVTQVCHMWREVALGMPMLWTHIEFSRHPVDFKWTTEMLRRSKQCPLVVILNFPVSDPLVYADVKANLGRCRVLSLRSVDTSTLHSFSSDIDLSQLEHLRITFERGLNTVPDEVISTTKSLRRLRIVYGDISLDNPSLLHLTHLTIYRKSNGRQLNCHSLLRILSRMSVLEELRLAGFTLATSPGLTVASLKTLKRLALSTDIASINLFLQQTQLSRTCKVQLVSRRSQDVVTDFGQIVSWISEHIRSPQPSDGAQKFLQSFRLYLRDNIIKIRGFHEVVSHEELIDGDPLFELTYYPSHELPDALSRTLLVSLPFTRLVFLEINIDIMFDLYSAVRLEPFARIPTLKNIFLGGGSRTFFSFLQVFCIQFSPDLPFPNLRTITVNEFVDHEGILKGLKARFQLAAPLAEILFSNSFGLPPDNVLRQLREVVEHVGIHDSGLS